MKKLLKVIIPLVLVLSAVPISIRIYNINKNIPLPQVLEYKEGDLVPLEEDYFWQIKENSSGYIIGVLSSRLETYSDYIHELGETEEYIDEGYRPDFVYILEVLVKNTNTDENIGRGFDFIDMRVQSINETMQVNQWIFGLLYPELSGSDGFRVRPGTEKTMTLPFTRAYSENGYGTLDDFSNENFYLLLSMYPRKKIIKLN